LLVGHHYTSTYTGSHFTTGLMLTKHLPGRHVTVTHDTLTVRVPGASTEHRALRHGEIEEWLETLEVPLTSHEEAHLLTTLRALATP
jgi:N-hydroxyarylamine O-acetyltransferase